MPAEAWVEVALDVSLDLRTNPLGAAITVTVPDAPTAAAREALLDSVEARLVGERNNLVFQTIQQAHDQLDAYASTHEYDAAPIKDSLEEVEASRDSRSIHVAWSWGHDAAMFWEFGTSDHTIDGDPVLVFEFDPEEYPHLDEMFPGGTAFLAEVDVAGLPEARWVRDSLTWLRHEVAR